MRSVQRLSSMLSGRTKKQACLHDFVYVGLWNRNFRQAAQEEAAANLKQMM